MSYPENHTGIYDIVGLKRGDTWSGLKMEVKYDDVPEDITGYQIKMQVRERYDAPTPLISISDGNGISFDQNDNSAFFIDPLLIDCKYGRHCYDIQFTLPNGDIKTYLKGSFVVTPDITQ
jgi:hypothetical protein